MHPAVLEVKELSKNYKTFRKDPGLKGTFKSFVKREHVTVEAVKSSSFVIGRGEFVGLLGPNGAGKTTILKMLTGLTPPSSGSAVAFGRFDTRDRVKSYLMRIGMVMGQRNQLHPDLPAMDSFRLSQAIYGISEDRFKARLQTCLDLFDIHHKATVPVRKLSLGERMKMELILAILHEPELLFLDEPTIGLDFNAAQQIRNFLKQANAELGITIILTSHYTKDIEELCRRVIVINTGAVIYDGALEGLDERLKGERIIQVTTTKTSDLELVEQQVISKYQKQRASDHSAVKDRSVKFSVPSQQTAQAIHDIFRTVGAENIEDILVEERSLEEIFTDLYAKSSNGLRR